MDVRSASFDVGAGVGFVVFVTVVGIVVILQVLCEFRDAVPHGTRGAPASQDSVCAREDKDIWIGGGELCDMECGLVGSGVIVVDKTLRVDEVSGDGYG